MHGVTPSKSAKAVFAPRVRGASPHVRGALIVAAAAMLPLVAACSDSGPASPEVPTTEAPSQNVSHGPFFPECGGVSDQEVVEQTRVAGLVTSGMHTIASTLPGWETVST